jgi:glyoxylase I family protein
MRVHHLALRVADIERSLGFYSALLGLPEVRRNPAPDGLRSVWLAAGDALLMLERRLAGVGAESGSAHLLAFGVEDLASWEKRLRGAGVRIEDRTDSTLYVNDPDGHRVGLSTHTGRDPR